MFNIRICGQNFDAVVVTDFYAFELLLIEIYLPAGPSGMYITYEELQGYVDEYNSSLERS